MTSNSGEVSLRVAEARSRDVGRFIVRIPQRYMRILGIEPGEYVEIIGNKRSAYAQVWPAYPDDEDKDYIRMDGVLRQNAGVSIGDVVRVRKANLRSAQRVTIAPVGEYIRVDPDYLKRPFHTGLPRR
jgi:transitional endoplasmic reticulum ATPase